MKDAKNKGAIEFLRVEALSALTFSRIALGSRDQQKTDCNRANARKACDCLLHFMPRITATKCIAENRAKMAELNSSSATRRRRLAIRHDRWYIPLHSKCALARDFERFGQRAHDNKT
jgi:hypothetical protein